MNHNITLFCKSFLFVGAFCAVTAVFAPRALAQEASSQATVDSSSTKKTVTTVTTTTVNQQSAQENATDSQTQVAPAPTVQTTASESDSSATKKTVTTVTTTTVNQQAQSGEASGAAATSGTQTTATQSSEGSTSEGQKTVTTVTTTTSAGTQRNVTFTGTGTSSNTGAAATDGCGCACKSGGKCSCGTSANKSAIGTVIAKMFGVSDYEDENSGVCNCGEGCSCGLPTASTTVSSSSSSPVVSTTVTTGTTSYTTRTQGTSATPDTEGTVTTINPDGSVTVTRVQQTSSASTTTSTTPKEAWTISVNTIFFDPDAATFKTLTASQIKSNNDILDSVASQVKAFGKNVTVRVIGHANNVSNTEKEHVEELIPLSLDRARAIRQELIKRGLKAENLTAEGMGGAYPVAAWEDHDNWWKNRRVEFVVTMQE